jgi:hypothetical protein
VFFRNERTQIMIAPGSDEEVDNYTTGEKRPVPPRNIVLRGNTVVATGPESHLLSFPLEDTLLRSVASENNTWFHPSDDRRFLALWGKPLTYAAWKQRTGQGRGSVWADPGIEDPETGNVRHEGVDR